MADPFSVLAITLLVIGGAILLRRSWQEAPSVAPLDLRQHVRATTVGPVAAALASFRGYPPRAFEAAVEGQVRRELDAWIAAGGSPESLAPILVAALAQTPSSEWHRREALARYRGPRSLFPVIHWFRTLAETEESRTIRYLDALTRSLRQAVDRT